MEDTVNKLIDDLVWPTAEVTRSISAMAKGDLSQSMRWRSRAARCRGSSCGRRHRQHDDRADERVHVGGDARGARSRHRGQARRSGQVPGLGGLEGPDGQRELDGQQPDRAGAQHLGGDDRGRERRPLAQDHGRRARRDPAAEGGHQHDGGRAAFVRLRGDGAGIPESDLAQVFEMFYQGKTPTETKRKAVSAWVFRSYGNSCSCTAGRCTRTAPVPTSERQWC